MKMSLLTKTVRGWSAISSTSPRLVIPAKAGIHSWLLRLLLAGAAALGILLAIAVNGARASDSNDEKAVAQLDTQYQAAVKRNDAAVMDRILADDFALVTGSGKTFTKADLLNEARSGRFQYERQDDTAQKVRVWGDTAVVTAKLWGKGAENGKRFDHTLWFSDTYVRTPAGWRYVFGQASLPLPETLK